MRRGHKAIAYLQYFKFYTAYVLELRTSYICTVEECLLCARASCSFPNTVAYSCREDGAGDSFLVDPMAAGVGDKCRELTAVAAGERMCLLLAA